jgi:hypothetical protein
MAGKDSIDEESLSALERRIIRLEKKLSDAESSAGDTHREIRSNLEKTARRIADVMGSDEAYSFDVVTGVKEVATESGNISLHYITGISSETDISAKATYELREILKEHELAVENYAARMVRKSIECQKNYAKLLETTSIVQVFRPVCEAGTAIIYACSASGKSVRRIEASFSEWGFVRESASPIDGSSLIDGSANQALEEEGKKGCADVYVVCNKSRRVDVNDAVEYAWESILNSRVQDAESGAYSVLCSRKGPVREMLYYVDAAIPFMGRKPEGLQ